ncbi:MAG TPA: MFS transporter [Chthonomonadaceae bacterium]|nr:MFS transporter [Chthonomonadaceae bacterium]
MRAASEGPPQTHDPYAALRYNDFRLLVTGRFLTTLGGQMVDVAVGWQLYEQTHSALALGLVGLVEVMPVILLALYAGHLADRLDRKRLVLATRTAMVVCSLGLAALAYLHGPPAWVYACLLGMGIANAFNGPASSTLLPQTVPPAIFSNAATWSSNTWQLAAALGPALGGGLIALFRWTTWNYLLNAFMGIAFIVLIALMRGQQTARGTEENTLESLAAGIRFLRSSQLILAAITLDMFAVLLGGATTLLPIYAKDILHVGPVGLGWTRTAPSVGAVVTALILAHRPPLRRAGRTLIGAVAGFGAATIVFGFSRSFPLSLAMLCLMGAFDNISVVVRSTLLLVRTPDELRGRVSAINNIFVGTSNELGGFESGLVAQWLGPVISVVAGGVGTILVVVLTALIWPELRRLGALDEKCDPSI